jgi:hypothetical protein
MDKTLDMAREAGAIHIHKQPKEFAIVGNGSIKAFEALVRADERKEMQVESEADKVIIECHEATIKRLEAGILAEREACAKVCEEYADDVRTGVTCAKAIRARGQA